MYAYFAYRTYRLIGFVGGLGKVGFSKNQNANKRNRGDKFNIIIQCETVRMIRRLALRRAHSHDEHTNVRILRKPETRENDTYR